jgi:hypothetical protein
VAYPAATTYFWNVYAVSEGGFSTALNGSQSTAWGTLSGNEDGWSNR